MGTSQRDQFVVRLRLWPVWLGWTVMMQTLLLILLLMWWAGRLVLVGEWRVEVDTVVGVSAGFALNAAGGLLIAGMTRFYSGAVLTADGIRPYYPTGKHDRVYSWREVLSVEVRTAWLWGRWVWVAPLGGTPFTLPVRPADPDGFREAVERFAGPDHPLAVALAEAEEGA